MWELRSEREGDREKHLYIRYVACAKGLVSPLFYSFRLQREPFFYFFLFKRRPRTLLGGRPWTSCFRVDHWGRGRPWRRARWRAALCGRASWRRPTPWTGPGCAAGCAPGWPRCTPPREDSSAGSTAPPSSSARCGRPVRSDRPSAPCLPWSLPSSFSWLRGRNEDRVQEFRVFITFVENPKIEKSQSQDRISVTWFLQPIKTWLLMARDFCDQSRCVFLARYFYSQSQHSTFWREVSIISHFVFFPK